MKKKFLLITILSLALSGCSKTSELYRRDQYNSPIFNENYYEIWDGIDKLNIHENIGLYSQLSSSYSEGPVKLVNGNINYNKEEYVWLDTENIDHRKEFGYNNNLALSDSNKEFRYGMTSKLFDGRVRCEGYYQLSRVQLNRNGFAMRFPKYLVSTSYLAFACRGGTDFKDHEFKKTEIEIDVDWTFYKETEDQNKYESVKYQLEKVKIPVDNGGNTALVSFMPYFGEDFSELNGAAAMSFEWRLSNVDDKVNDDYRNNEKEHHMALMLYEIFIGNSSWR